MRLSLALRWVRVLLGQVLRHLRFWCGVRVSFGYGSFGSKTSVTFSGAASGFAVQVPLSAGAAQKRFLFIFLLILSILV